jgi:uncharacterized protein YndB with AHSA1/START domain
MKKSILSILVILAGLCFFINAQTDSFTVTRSLAIAAPPEIIFDQVNDFHNWEKWSPWAALDPDMTHTYTGPTSGVGASFSWKGNNKVGEGSNTILAIRHPELIQMRSDWIKPMPGSSTVAFTFNPQADTTIVTWQMKGTKNFLAKAIGLIMDCDKMAGDQFETGLLNLKNLIENL